MGEAVSGKFGISRWKEVTKTGENRVVKSENYNLGEVEGLEKYRCVYCGKEVEEGRFPDGCFPVCEKDWAERIRPRERAEKFADGLDTGFLEGEDLEKYFGFLHGAPGPVPPKCIYCGKEMEVLEKVPAGYRVGFLWVCPDKHWNIVTGSFGGIG